jgi:hypothetical protein
MKPLIEPSREPPNRPRVPLPGRSPNRRRRRAVALAGLLGVLGLTGTACSTSGTPSVAAPPSTVTVTATTTARTTSTVTETATVTETPTSTQASTLVAATFKDPSTFECTDASADSCWALDVTTTGPCPNGVYVAINVYKKDQNDVLKVLDTTTSPVTDALGTKIEVMLSQTGLSSEGETLEADLKEARCA